jgi:WXG100 family type VII secretion target
MNGIRVTPEQLHTVSMGVARGSTEIDSTLAGLRGQVLPMVGGEWAGAASAQFTAMFEQWQRAANELSQALRGISHLLAGAGAGYAQVERDIVTSFMR